MKRPPKPFVVERKRRSPVVPRQPASIWSGAVGHELRSLVKTASEESGRAERSLRAPVSLDRDPIGDPVALGGRILEARASASVSIEHDRADDIEADPNPDPNPVPGSQRVGSRSPQDALPLVADPTDEAPTPDPSSGSAAAAPAESSRSRLVCYRQRRQATRNALPLSERWRWDLPFLPRPR